MANPVDLHLQQLRIEAEKRLKDWHYLMQHIIHHDPNGIAVLDRNLHFLFVSDRFAQEYLSLIHISEPTRPY